MKLVLIADTHTQQADLTVPDGDVLIHVGDFSEGSSMHGQSLTRDFLDWFALQPHEHKIFIAGNHDFWAEKNKCLLADEAQARDLIYLMDEWTEIDGVKFWGTPWVPNLLGWAFHERGPAYASRRLGAIDIEIDVMISHGPPFGIGDRLSESGERVGCPALLQWANDHQPRVHVSGHIHEDAGLNRIGETTFVNASVLNEHYVLTNDPVVVEL